MRTQLLGRLDIDETRLLADLERTSEFHYSEPYVEFLCGRPWKSAMLWAAGGEIGDSVIAHYDTSKKTGATPYGERLPYLLELIERNFATEHLLFVRLAIMSDSVLIPHRDYVEFADEPAKERAGHRLHIALRTSEDCLFSEDENVFRMKFGEVWFLDVTRQHSAGVLSDIQRAHLILDFAAVDDGSTLVKFPVMSGPGIPDGSLVDRPALADRERKGVLALSSIVDLDTLREVFGVVIKKNYRKNGGANFVWGTIEEIGRRSGDPAVRAKIEELHKYYLLERDQ